MSIAYGSGKNIILSKNDKIRDQLFIRPNVATCKIGNGFSFDYQLGSYGRDSVHRIINEIDLEFRVRNLSNVGSDNFQFVSLWHLLSKCDVYVNNTKIFELPQKSFNLGHVWQHNLSKVSADLNDLDKLFYGETNVLSGYVGNTVASNLFQTIIGSQSSGYIRHDLSHLLAFFNQVDTQFIHNLRLEFEIDGMVDGRFSHRMPYIDSNGTGSAVGIAEQFEVYDISLVVNYDGHASKVVHPTNDLTILSKKYFQRVYPQPFTGSTTFTVNLERDFSMISRAKNVQFWLYDATDTATQSAKSIDYKDNARIVSMNYTRDGVLVNQFKSQGQVFKHMNESTRNIYGSDLMFTPADTFCNYLWYFDLTDINSQTTTAPKLNNKTHILGGKNTKNQVHEVTLTVSGTSNHNLIAIIDSDYLAICTPSQSCFILES